MVQKFRKKPVVIEAIQWNSESNINEILKWCPWIVSEEKFPNGPICYWVKTLEGVMQLSFGDYIIKGVKGEFYPCKPDIFEATYDLEP